MATTTVARTTGSTPLSPFFTRAHQPRRYSPNDWAMISEGTSSTSAAAVRSGANSVVVRGSSLLRAIGSAHRPVERGAAGRDRASARTPGRHVLHRALSAELGNRPLRHHPAQVEHRDPVRDLEDV